MSKHNDSDSKKSVGVVQTQRRTWDKEVYMKKAIEREIQLDAETSQEPLARKLPQKKVDPNVIDLQTLKPAQARTQDLKLEQTEGGFFCKTCGCQLKDSQSYLDHINGKKHLRAEGMSLRPERATVDEVRAKLSRKVDPVAEALAAEKERKEQKQRELEQKRKEEEQRELEEKLRKKEKKLKKKKKKAEAEAPPASNPEDDVLAAMGLPFGFGSSKK